MNLNSMIYIWRLYREIVKSHDVICLAAHGGMFSIQHCMINFVSDLRQFCGFLKIKEKNVQITDKTEILLKVILNTDQSINHITNSTADISHRWWRMDILEWLGWLFQDVRWRIQRKDTKLYKSNTKLLQ